MSQHVHTLYPEDQQRIALAIENAMTAHCSICSATPQIILVWPEQISVQVHVLQSQHITPLEKKE